MKRDDFLKHVAWTGTGIAWSLSSSGLFNAQRALAAGSGISFVQISDSHIGFSHPENPDVAGTFQQTIDAINAMPVQPTFVVHTGDVTHLSKPAQFDTAKQILGTLKAPLVVLPGEHDVIGTPGAFFAAFGQSNAPKGWSSWDQGGVHFLSLVNVFNFEIDGKLGPEQLDFVEKDLAAQKSSTPIVVFAHVPLYALFPPWGWTTEDGSRVLAALRRFNAVTVLNGHIHQIVQHTDGNIRFATAASTAYPQPAPGTADKPGPLASPAAASLLSVLGTAASRSRAILQQSPITHSKRNNITPNITHNTPLYFRRYSNETTLSTSRAVCFAMALAALLRRAEPARPQIHFRTQFRPAARRYSLLVAAQALSRLSQDGDCPAHSRRKRKHRFGRLDPGICRKRQRKRRAEHRHQPH